jgi:cytochrome c oxidase cbb3-type subunit 3
MSNYEKDRLLEHDADGIREYDNRLPKWWLWGFYFTIFMAVVYLFYYHVYTGRDWNFLWYTQRGQEQEYTAEMAKFKPVNATAADLSAFSAKSDAATLAAGEKIFQQTNLCYTCHRQDLGGLVGPNLTDDYWLHGGKFSDIMQSIMHGYPEKGMQKFGNGNSLTQDQVIAVASYVVSKHGSNPANPKPVDPARDVLVK